MNYTAFFSQLEEASLFDLYRLSVAINHELNNPARIKALKKRLRIGMTVDFFNPKDQSNMPITITGLRATVVIGRDISFKKEYQLPYCMINLKQVETTIDMPGQQLTRHNLKVGDWVGFHYKGFLIRGVIKRLNSKTVTLKAQAEPSQWRVSYTCLHRVHEGEIRNEYDLITIEGEENE